jgi:hypothetical protein
MDNVSLLRSVSITCGNLDIIHSPFFYLKHDVSETTFCLRLQVETAQLGTIDRDSKC